MNEPAFPAPEYLISRGLDKNEAMKLGMSRGMTLRDYFAGKAMQGLITIKCARDLPGDESRARVALIAYKLADAMLKARESHDPQS